MPSPVYLDTARLGRISPTALAIQTDYLRFSAKRCCSPALHRLLLHGGQSWSVQLQSEYPHLASWRGVGPLKRRLRRIVGADEQARVMLASRSQTLMELASYLLLRNSGTVVTVDLAWPRYRQTLQQVAQQLGRKVIQVGLREAILSGDHAEAIVDRVLSAFRTLRGASLFLPAISHDGVCLPVGEIARAVQAASELRFFVVDGAQHLAHGEARWAEMDCDFYLAGTHKWLRSLYPLGVGVYGQPRSQALVETTVAELRAAGILTDPLSQFTAQLESRELDGVTETVNLSALLSAHGAARDARPASARPVSFEIQLENAEHLAEIAAEHGWQCERPNPTFRTGILMLRPPRDWDAGACALQHRFAASGVIATAYDHGAIRFSLPRRRLSPREVAIIQRSLSGSCATVKL